MKNEVTIILAIACAVGTVVALLPLPYGFYTLLRVLFFCSLLVAAFALYENSTEIGIALIVAGGLAVLFNPLIPVHLGSKPLWFIANIVATAVVYYASKSAANSEREI